MGKLAFIAGVLIVVLCSIAQAHRPIFSDKSATDPNTAVLISKPAISQVIYREITHEADQVWLAFDVNEGFDLFIQIGVPVLDRLKKFRPAMLVVGLGLPKVELPFELPEEFGSEVFPTDDIEEPRFFHEHFTGTDSWILRSDTVKIPKSGRYYLVAYVPSGDKGKLWLSVGKQESFGLAEWAQFGEWKKKIRAFHEVSETGEGLRIPILSDIGDMLKSSGSLKSTADGTIVEVKLTDNGQAFINPDMGWTMHYYSNIITNYGSKLESSDTLEDFPGLSTVYLCVPWAFIEPDEGNYNWSLLDTPAQRWIDKGKVRKFTYCITHSIYYWIISHVVAGMLWYTFIPDEISGAKGLISVIDGHTVIFKVWRFAQCANGVTSEMPEQPRQSSFFRLARCDKGQRSVRPSQARRLRVSRFTKEDKALISVNL